MHTCHENYGSKKQEERNKRNKILNYKEETVQSVIVYDEISCFSSAGTCDCERSSFCDKHHDHIIIGD